MSATAPNWRAQGAEPFDPAAIARQILAVLDEERRALAALDRDAILGCANDKAALCQALEGASADLAVDTVLRDLLLTARRMNDSNARLRNLVAGKVGARLGALTGRPALYRVRGASTAWRR